MAKYLIGLDFGTSQTKVCIFNQDSDSREFLKFENDDFFLPSLIVKKNDDTFSYGNENDEGIKYRYFKMSAAEDEQLIQTTNEDLQGKLNGENDDFRKYTIKNIASETLVILYLTYIYLYIKKKKTISKSNVPDGLLGQLAGKSELTENTFSINLGIPTEWHNPNHIKRKIKFQTLLLTAIILANKFQNLEQYLSKSESALISEISEINTDHLKTLPKENSDKKSEQINFWLKKFNLSVFPESAAGINYLLQTKRLADGSYATLDIGAGTSDIAIFSVKDNKLNRYYCSESVAIASNDFYREYAKQFYQKENISFHEIKEIETKIQNDYKLNDNFYRNAKNIVKGFLNSKGIEFAIRKTFYRKYYKPLHEINQEAAFHSKNRLNEQPLIVFGGGANLEGFSKDNYCFYQGSNEHGKHDKVFVAIPITDYVTNIDISNDSREITNSINLLILALGLTYSEQSFNFSSSNSELNYIPPDNPDRYFYYDLQDAAYK